MADTANPVHILTPEQCWERLRAQELGRLVTHVGDVIDIFPVNYVVDGESLVFRTAPGSKLFGLTVNDDVLFEVDDHSDADAWSVIARGRAERVEDAAEIEHVETLGLRPWIPTLKYTFVRVTVSSVTGRDFQRGEEPDRFGVQPY